jgi:transposase InsO family protein
MHRTLKKQASQPPAADAEERRARFKEFRRHYNEERLHEALGQRQTPPTDLCAPSPRDAGADRGSPVRRRPPGLAHATRRAEFKRRIKT